MDNLTQEEVATISTALAMMAFHYDKEIREFAEHLQTDKPIYTSSFLDIVGKYRKVISGVERDRLINAEIESSEQRMKRVTNILEKVFKFEERLIFEEGSLGFIAREKL